MSDPVVIVSARRTAIGSFQGQFSNTSTTQLGAAAIEAAVADAGVQKEQLSEVIMGCVLHFLDAATAQGNVDEAKVQEIASRQGATIAKLLVEKEHFKARIYSSVLTPEQRTKADQLQARWHERMSHMSDRLQER